MLKKYRIHYAHGASEEVVTEETREQLLAQCKPITDVVLLDDETSVENPVNENKKTKATSKKGQE